MISWSLPKFKSIELVVYSFNSQALISSMKLHFKEWKKITKDYLSLSHTVCIEWYNKDTIDVTIINVRFYMINRGILNNNLYKYW